MKPGQAIHVQLADIDGKPLPIENILVWIHLYTLGNYRYGFEAGRTNAEGRLVVTYDDLEKQRREDGAFFVMDYNTPLEECDPIAKLIVDSEGELRSRQQGALKSSGKQPTFATPWPSNRFVEVESTTVELAERVVNVELSARWRPAVS
jgi:hypothetical protein